MVSRRSVTPLFAAMLAAIASIVASACGEPAKEAPPPVVTTDATAPAPEDAGVLEPIEAGADAGLVWPSGDHVATSDPWIAEHHDELTQMRPRVLALNLDNDPATRSKFAKNVEAVMAGLNEGSRYHGYASKDAPPFLAYEVAKWVDMADETPPPGWTHKYASRAPVRCTPDPSAWYTADYARLFSDEYTRAYDVKDPKDATGQRRLGLCEMFERGMVHEVWIHMNGDPDPYTCPDGKQLDVGFAEILEAKPKYVDGKPTRDFERCAGNGCLGDQDLAAFTACGRTVRVLYVNSTRGPGCAIHSAGHGFEWMARSDAVPSLREWFEPFGNFDLRERLKLPFGDWYACDGPGCITWTGPNALTWKVKDKTGSIASYDQACGNVHFAPNARAHYDENDTSVMSTCETYGIGGVPEPFSRAKYARYEALAPDCGGAWQVYWRQSFPGLATKAKGPSGRPMKNWWPFLFY